MENLKTSLKQKFKGAKKIAILGIGSELRGDDIAGMLIAEKLQKALNKYSEMEHQKLRVNNSAASRRNVGVKIFFGATAPENLTGEIRKFSPTHLVIFDTIDIGKNAGEISIIDKEKIAGISFCTHRLPIKIMTDYLMQSINCETIIIGIQPETVDFLSLPSDTIKYSVKNIIKIMRDVLIPDFYGKISRNV